MKRFVYFKGAEFHQWMILQRRCDQLTVGKKRHVRRAAVNEFHFLLTAEFMSILFSKE